jgi:hypothetical protein
MGLHGLEVLESLKGLKGLACQPGLADLQSAFRFQIGGGPMLGVTVEAMSDQLASFFGAEPGRGVLVKDVVESSAADAAGIEAGDVVLRVGKTDVRSVGDVHAALADLEAGDKVEVEVLRRGARRTLIVTMNEARRTGMLAPGCFVVPDADEIERMTEELEMAQDAMRDVDTAEEMAQVQRALEEAAADMARAGARMERSRDLERSIQREVERQMEREMEGERARDRGDSDADDAPARPAKRMSSRVPAGSRSGRMTHVAE